MQTLELFVLMAEAKLVKMRADRLVRKNESLGDQVDFKSLMIRMDIIEALIKCTKRQERITIRFKEILDEREARDNTLSFFSHF